MSLEIVREMPSRRRLERMRAAPMGLGLGIDLQDVGSGGAWNPLTIAPGNVLFLNSRTVASVVLDGSGNVSQWTDLSGNGNHFTQGTAIHRPPPIANGVNGGYSVHGDGTSITALQGVNTMAAMLGAATAAELLILMQYTADGSGNAAMNQWGGGGQSDYVKFSDTNMYNSFASSARHQGAAVGAGVVTSPFVLNVRSTNGAFSMFLNGVQNFTTATNTFAAVALGPFIIGAGTATCCPANWAMVLMWPFLLTPTQRAAIIAGMV